MAEVKITIKAEDNTSQQVFRAVESAGTSAMDKIKSSVTSMAGTIKEHWLAISAAGVAAWMAIGKAIDYAKLGASALQAEESFKNVANAYAEDADKLLSKMKQVSAGIIDDSDLMQRALKALQQGLSGNQIVQLLEVARASARVAGTDIASAFDGITNAVANQTTKSLKLYGIMVDQNKVFEEYAAKLGKTKDTLTEMEQSQALANAAIEEGGRQMKAMGEITENASERIQKSAAQIHELKETIGKGLLVVIQALGGLMYWLAGGVMVAASAFMELGAGILFATGRFKEAKQLHQDAKIMFAAAGEQAGKGMDIWKGISMTTKDAAAGAKGLAKAQQDAAAAASLHAAEEVKAKKALEDTVKTLKEMASAIDKVGEAQLKMAGEGFNEALKTAGDNIDALRTATASYLTVIENVYSKRLAGEKAVAELMKKAGADPAALAQQQAKILETEISGANARLGAWKQYYGVLEGLHKSALDKMTQKTQQLFDLEKSRMAQENGYADLQNSLRQKLMTDEQKYYDQLEILRMKFDAAQLLSGEAKIKALTDWQSARAAMANEIKSGDAVIISQETAVKEAMLAIAQAQDDIAREYAETKAARESELAQLASYTQELETAMAYAADMVDDYRQSIVELDAELEVQRILSIDASQAKQAINDVQAAMAAVQDKTVTITVLTQNVVVGFDDTSMNVDFTGTGSPKKPLSEKLFDYRQQMDDLSRSVPHNLDFSRFSSGLDAAAGKSNIMGSAATKTKSATEETAVVEKLASNQAKFSELLATKLAEIEGKLAFNIEAQRHDFDGAFDKLYAGEIARDKATVQELRNALDLLSRGVPDSILKGIEELYMKLATAQGNRAFNDAAQKSDHDGNFDKLYASEMAKESAIIRALENAIAALLRSVSGSYAEGTRSVPETGLYRLHQGEAVIPAAMNPFKNNQSSTTPSQQTNISFAPTVQVISSGDAKADAANIDAEIATLWRGNRSRLRQEFEQPVGRR